VATASLPAARPGAVTIGIGGVAAVPQSLDLTGPGGGLLVTGRRRSGVSTALTVLASSAAASGLTVIRPTLRPAPPLPAVRDIDLRPGAELLRRELAEHEGPVLLVVDDADRLIEHPAADLFIRFLGVAARGQYLALGVRLDHAVRSHRGLIAEVAAFRTGVLLGVDAVDAGVLDTSLPRRRGPAPPGRGHLVINGTPTAIQIALPGLE
jgi:S-DNA-T family DNA segregation ATPase FtsK/SpoIIIE